MTTAMKVGSQFRLIGRETVFTAVELYNAAGFIPAVVGVNAEHGAMTVARVADVVAVPASSTVEG